jgi:hypothetical protein
MRQHLANFNPIVCANVCVDRISPAAIVAEAQHGRRVCLTHVGPIRGIGFDTGIAAASCKQRIAPLLMPAAGPATAPLHAAWWSTSGLCCAGDGPMVVAGAFGSL